MREKTKPEARRNAARSERGRAFQSESNPNDEIRKGPNREETSDGDQPNRSAKICEICGQFSSARDGRDVRPQRLCKEPEISACADGEFEA